MQLEYGVVAFVDLLGYRAMVARDSGAPVASHLPALVRVTSAVRSLCAVAGATLHAFSDSMILSLPLSPNGVVAVVRLVRELQRQLIGEGIIVRGGVAFGKHFDENNVVFSEALIRAYELESSCARVPRVVLDLDLVDYVANHESLHSVDREWLAQATLVDDDGRRFVHYLDEEIRQAHAAACCSTLNAAARLPGVLDKALWLIRYHNFVFPGDVHGPTFAAVVL